MSEMERAIESYEAEIKELKQVIQRLQSDLKNAEAEIRAGDIELKDKTNQIHHLSGMVDALKSCTRDILKSCALRTESYDE